MYNELIENLRLTERVCRDRMDGQVMLDAADAIELLTAEREQMRDKLIRRICSHCDSVLVGCEGCPIIGEVKAVFDEQQS